MSQTTPYEPSPELIELVQRVLDKEASLDDIAHLNHIIPSDPEARRYFVKMRMLHSSLMDHYGQTSSNIISLKEAAKKSTSSQTVTPAIADTGTHKPRSKRYLLAAAAVLLFSLAGTLVYQSFAPKDAYQVVAILGAENKEHFTTDSWLKTKEQYEVKTGLVELHSADGNKITIQGPAKFTIEDLKTIQLNSGKAWAVLDGPSIDIKTTQGIVRDIGTTFGIDHSNTKVTRIDVFDGKVQVTDKSTANKQAEAEAGVALIAVSESWPPDRTEADASLYITGLRRAVGFSFVNKPEDISAITSSLPLDTQWTPLIDHVGTAYPGGTNLEIRWAGSSITSTGGNQSNLSKIYHTHLLGWPWSDNTIEKATDLQLPENGHTGIVLQIRNISKWLAETNAIGYKVEILRNTGVRKATLRPVSLYSGSTTTNLVETLDPMHEKLLSADYPDQGNSVGFRVHQTFSDTLTEDVVTITVPGQPLQSNTIRSNISAVRLIPVFE
ncbi:hypothetical protein Rhal01_00626 [Rubritalea halochordaticola]|uniref:FecR protein domain-containing protein n=1 Tax=Rubritalea halochordaticola TaxID=714537 RepID=A0ABP9UXM2_9BACT